MKGFMIVCAALIVVVLAFIAVKSAEAQAPPEVCITLNRIGEIMASEGTPHIVIPMVMLDALSPVFDSIIIAHLNGNILIAFETKDGCVTTPQSLSPAVSLSATGLRG